MTDTGRVPGEGLPENAVGEAVPQPPADLPGSAAHQPTAPSWGSDALSGEGAPPYTFLDQPAPPGSAVDDDEDLLLMPGLQGSWSDPQPVPPQPAVVVAPATGEGHESGGRDSGSIEYGTVRLPQPAQPLPEAATPAPDLTPAPAPVLVQEEAEQIVEPVPVPVPVPVAESFAADQAAAQPAPPRRPLHMGPPMPDPASSGVSVRSLADRGPAQAQGPTPAPVPAPARAPGPPTAGPEYLDVPHSDSASIPAQQNGVAPEPAAAAPPGTPVQGSAWPAAAPAAPVAQVQAQAQSQSQDLPVPPVIAESVPDPEPVHSHVPVQPQTPVQVQNLIQVPVPAPAPDSASVSEESRTQHAGTPVPHQNDGPAVFAPAAPVAPVVVVAAEPVPAVASLPEPAPGPELAQLPEHVQPVVTATGEPQETPAVPAETITPVASPAQAPADAPLPEPVVPDAVPDALPEPVAVPIAVAPVAETPAPVAQEDVSAPEAAGPELPIREEPAGDAVAPGAPAAAELPGTPDESAGPLAGAAVRQPAADGYEPAVRDAVHRVIRERRDIRNGFRDDPIPHEVLLRVLEAAHTAPSVGHSQPWDFVVIRSAKTRQRMHELAMEQRDAYAKSLPKARAKQFRELKIEAILDTPVNIVVTADPTRGGRHTLGRHTQPQMAPYSSALAVENLWLAARAEGLGVGWVSFFDERQMVRELGLPDHLEIVAYLCVGYVDEFPEEPELMQAGWSQRRPLSWVVHEEEYGNRALPGEEPHDLLEETLRGIRPLDAKALGEAWERQKRMTKPAGALGMLEIISAQLSGLSRQCPPPIPEPAAVAIFAGDHGVHAQGVTSWPQEVTAQMVANFLGGGAVCNAFANQVGAEVCVIDVGVASDLPSTPGLLPRKVRYGTADFTAGPAMTRDEVLRAIEVGIETARDLVSAGNKALLTGEMGIANTTTSAALISVYTGQDPAEVTGRGTGINDEMHARKIDVVRRALDLHRPDPADPIGVLEAIGGLEHAAIVGLLLGAAALRTPVILDGVSAGAAALVARAIAPEVLAACIAGHRSAEPGHAAALTKLGLRPLIDLDLRLGEGTGALLALPLVQSAARVMHEVATFDSAGVTEKG
ncbi:nicotinate-nucleotide--dimethylbenzimidazole phosphoribosyltransferase [Streptomyces sp. H10-C2]|uniref:nicotinate-nucleotide--dimethylbenzimidazole phosphoribosyltransferase n=1 Tax=Streptomyces sp. H10-C2 TaxID=3046210 RepID=UPI0024B9F030|nr:nicotinate-nucleotide--dimethylbenzimidazole phosphoribosyltransferase [Streptomyces sp. H10-C2]MDJ0370787.1 nicotinate-nucleotide--dimethylbenzimidazole phosphoribosyltransferase [Streptomyces sp. H10-C2]